MVLGNVKDEKTSVGRFLFLVKIASSNYHNHLKKPLRFSLKNYIKDSNNL
jgi:hypothetical protein